MASGEREERRGDQGREERRGWVGGWGCRVAMAADGRPFVPPFPGSSLEPPRLQLRWSLPEREGEKGGTMICPSGIFQFHKTNAHTHASDVEERGGS